MVPPRIRGRVEKVSASTVLALAAGLLVTLSPQPAAADLSVALGAQGTLVLIGARYDVSVTNHGPDAVGSASVVLALDGPFTSNAPANCAVDTAAETITCAFGPLAAGSTATTSATVYLLHPNPGSGQFSATATRVASTPADPNPGNDSAGHGCWYTYQPGLPPYSLVVC